MLLLLLLDLLLLMMVILVLAGKGFSLKLKGGIHILSVGCLTYSSETWLMKVEHEMKLDRTEMKMIRWTCRFTLKESKKRAELRELLALDPVSLVTKNGRLRWFGHVERKDDVDWIKYCTVMEIDGIRQMG